MISSGRATRRRSVGRATLGAGAILAAILAFASASWACAFWNNPVAVVAPNRAPAASDVTVTGTGWQPNMAVTLALSTDGTTVLQPLGAARADADGKFSARVPLGQANAGVYYVSATQDATHTNVPLEVLESGGTLVGGSSQGWGSLDGGRATGLNDLRNSGEGGDVGFPWAVVGIVGGLLVLGGTLLATELRRQRATK